MLMPLYEPSTAWHTAAQPGPQVTMASSGEIYTVLLHECVCDTRAWFRHRVICARHLQLFSGGRVGSMVWRMVWRNEHSSILYNSAGITFECQGLLPPAHRR